MKRKYLYLLSGICALLFFTLNRCNHPETSSVSGTEFIITGDSSAIYLLDKRYFVLIPGDTALFYGSKRCTVIVNGTLDTCINDSAYLRTITLDREERIINNRHQFVYPQHYQYCSSFKEIDTASLPPDNTITRYFVKNDTAVLQIAYRTYKYDTTRDAGNDVIKKSITLTSTLHDLPPNKQKVLPKTLEVGKYGWLQTDTTNVPTNNKWQASPLIKNPLSFSKGTVSFEGFSVAPQGIALPGVDPTSVYTVNGVIYGNGVFIKTYYSIEGEIFEDGKNITVAGTVLITRTYFTDRGLVDQLINTTIRRSYSDTIQIIKETMYVARGPEGAKIYPDIEYPDG